MLPSKARRSYSCSIVASCITPDCSNDRCRRSRNSRMVPDYALIFFPSIRILVPPFEKFALMFTFSYFSVFVAFYSMMFLIVSWISTPEG